MFLRKCKTEAPCTVEAATSPAHLSGMYSNHSFAGALRLCMREHVTCLLNLHISLQYFCEQKYV
jgi:hypothetical protein